MISQVSYHRKPKRGRGHIYRLLSFGLLCAWMVTWSRVALAETTLPESILAFFENNCHDGDSAKGELDLKSLAFKPNDRADLKRWSLVYDRVRHHEIPPKGKANGRDAFLKEFETLMHNTSEAHQTAKGSVRSRRLNRTEFENTLHDLLGIDVPSANGFRGTRRRMVSTRWPSPSLCLTISLRNTWKSWTILWMKLFVGRQNRCPSTNGLSKPKIFLTISTIRDDGETANRFSKTVMP